MLEDEGLVTSRQSDDGKRLFDLTEAGKLEAAKGFAPGEKPWGESRDRESGPPKELVIAIGETAATLLAAAAQGNEEQRESIVQLLSEFRQSLVTLVPGANNVGPFGGRRRGPWGRSGPGWNFGVPDWIFGGPATNPFGPSGMGGGPRGTGWGGWPGSVFGDASASAGSGASAPDDVDDDEEIDEAVDAEEVDFEA
jgi:hypothetical protein